MLLWCRGGVPVLLERGRAAQRDRLRRVLLVEVLGELLGVRDRLGVKERRGLFDLEVVACVIGGGVLEALVAKARDHVSARHLLGRLRRRRRRGLWPRVRGVLGEVFVIELHLGHVVAELAVLDRDLEVVLRRARGRDRGREVQGVVFERYRRDDRRACLVIEGARAVVIEGEVGALFFTDAIEDRLLHEVAIQDVSRGPVIQRVALCVGLLGEQHIVRVRRRSSRRVCWGWSRGRCGGLRGWGGRFRPERGPRAHERVASRRGLLGEERARRLRWFITALRDLWQVQRRFLGEELRDSRRTITLGVGRLLLCAFRVLRLIVVHYKCGRFGLCRDALGSRPFKGSARSRISINARCIDWTQDTRAGRAASRNSGEARRIAAKHVPCERQRLCLWLVCFT